MRCEIHFIEISGQLNLKPSRLPSRESEKHGEVKSNVIYSKEATRRFSNHRDTSDQLSNEGLPP